MSRGSTPRHARTAGDLGFAVQFNAETPWHLCTYRLNWARRTSCGWWDEWDDTALQTQDSTFERWRSEAEHATSRSRRLPTIWNLYEWAERKHFSEPAISDSFKPLTAKSFIWIFTHSKLCLADAIHNFKLLKNIQIWQNGGQQTFCFQILLIDVTFYL